MRVQVNFIDLDDLESRIQFLFLRVVRASDAEGGEAARLSEEQLYSGFLHMGTVPPILFESDHWKRSVSSLLPSLLPSLPPSLSLSLPPSLPCKECARDG